jgi:hypothetical protein
VDVEAEGFCAVISVPELALEVMNVILTVLVVRLVGQHSQGVEGGISVPPKLEPLNCSNSLDLAEAVGAALEVGPNHVDVKKVDEIFPAQVALELDGSLDGGKLVPDWDELVVNADAVTCGIPDAVMVVEGQEAFHVRRIIELAMSRVKGVRVNI